MPEPISIIVGASQLVAPALNGLANLTKALKEPGGKRKIEELRQEFATTFDGIKQALEALQAELSRQQREQEQLRREIEYLKLPFWKRWFTQRPVPFATPDRALQVRSTKL